MKKTLGNFEVLDQIEPGGNSTVYRAVQKLRFAINRPAAIKVLQGWRLENQDQVQALKHEVEILLDATASPHIVEVLDFDIDPEVGPWIAMELLGPNLERQITDEPADPNQVRYMLRDILRALDVLHHFDPPIIHRDIKPNNILTSRFGVWKIADFGLARRHNRESTLNVLTVQYAAPELLDASFGRESPVTDLYSLGLSAYRFALGKRLYRMQFPSIYDLDDPSETTSGDDRAKWMYWHCSKQMTLKPVAELIPDFPKDLSDVIAGLSQKEPEKRIPSAREAIKQLSRTDGAVATFTLGGESFEFGDGKKESTSWVRSAVLAAVAIVLTLAVVAMFLLTQNPAPVIALAEGDVYKGDADTIVVSGRIDHIPQNSTIEIETPSGQTFPVNIENGQFSGEVATPRLGEQEVSLSIRGPGGVVLARKSFKVERVVPKQVTVVISTNPPTPGATVRFVESENPDTPVVVQTGEDGTASAPVKYGRFRLEIEHPLYRDFAAQAETGFRSPKTLKANLVARDEARRPEVVRPPAASPSEEPSVAQHTPVEQPATPPDQPPVTASPSEQPALLAELPPLADRLLEGDAQALRRVQEVAAALRSIAESSAAGPAVLQRRSELLAELPAVAAVALNKDLPSADRILSIHQELSALASLEEASPEGAGPTLDAINQSTLMALSPSQFRTFVAWNVPVGALELEDIPRVNQLRIRGPLFNAAEAALLGRRLAPALPRLRMEVRVDPWALCGRLEEALRAAGAEEVRVHAMLLENENTMYVQFKRGEALTLEQARALAERFVLDPGLLEIQVF